MTGRVGREAGGDRGVGSRNLFKGQLLEEFSGPGPGLPDGGRGVCVCVRFPDGGRGRCVCVHFPDGGRGVCVCVCVCVCMCVCAPP